MSTVVNDINKEETGVDPEAILKTVESNPDEEAKRQFTDQEIDMHDSVMQSIGTTGSVTKRKRPEDAEPETVYKQLKSLVEPLPEMRSLGDCRFESN